MITLITAITFFSSIVFFILTIVAFGKKNGKAKKYLAGSIISFALLTLIAKALIVFVFCASIVFFILTIVAFGKKDAKAKKHLVWFATSFALFMVLGIFTDTETDSASGQETAKTQLEHSSESVEDKKRDVEEAKAKKKAEEKEAVEAKKKEEEKEVAEAKKKAEEKEAAEAKKKAEEKEAAEAKKKEEEKAIAAETFAMDIPEFKETWEQVTNRSGMERINVISNEEFLEAEDSLFYTAEINDYILVQAELDIVTEEIKSILLETIPTEGEPINVSMDISIAPAILIAVIKPELTADERGEIIINKLGLGAVGVDQETLDNKYVINNVTYVAENMDGLLYFGMMAGDS